MTRVPCVASLWYLSGTSPLARMGTTRYAPGSDCRMPRKSSMVRVLVRAPTACFLKLPPKTSAASGPNHSTISTALRSAPSTAVTMSVSEATPKPTPRMTKNERTL